MSVDRVSTIRQILGQGRDAVYLEIGVQDGLTFRSVKAATRIGIDPGLRLRPTRHPGKQVWQLPGHINRFLNRKSGEILFPVTSDNFFRECPPWLSIARVDIALVDGLHTYEQAYRDALNCLGVLKSRGVILMHDCRPRSFAAAIPSHDQAKMHKDFSGTWNGDVYKAAIRLRCELDDYRVSVIDADQGLGIIFPGKSERRPSLSIEQIESLSFDEFYENRYELLDLLSTTAFTEEILPAIRACKENNPA